MFFREFVDELGFRERIQVRTFGSVNALQPYLELFASKAAFKEAVSKLAIVRDAEAQTAAVAFQSICSALKNAKLPAPNAMQRFSMSPLQTGVYVLPDCERSGMLETLCLEAAAECEANSTTKLLPCVDEFFGCVGTATTFDNLTKARFSAYALARGVVDPQLGRAAQKRILPCNAKAFEKLVAFVQELAV